MVFKRELFSIQSTASSEVVDYSKFQSIHNNERDSKFLLVFRVSNTPEIINMNSAHCLLSLFCENLGALECKVNTRSIVKWWKEFYRIGEKNAKSLMANARSFRLVHNKLFKRVHKTTSTSDSLYKVSDTHLLIPSTKRQRSHILIHFTKRERGYPVTPFTKWLSKFVSIPLLWLSSCRSNSKVGGVYRS